MIWNVTCRNVRRSLALWAGNDLDEAEQLATERHLAVCPHCREQWQQLQAGQQALEQARVLSQKPAALSASVWPAIERQIRAGEEPIANDWRAWLPTGALAAACLTILLVLPPAGPETADESGNGGGFPAHFSQAISAPVWRLREPSNRERMAGGPNVPSLLDAPRVRTLLNGTDARGLE